MGVTPSKQTTIISDCINTFVSSYSSSTNSNDSTSSSSQTITITGSDRCLQFATAVGPKPPDWLKTIAEKICDSNTVSNVSQTMDVSSTDFVQMVADANATSNATVKSKVEAAIETNAPTLFQGGVDTTNLVNSVTTAITDTISKASNDLTKEIRNTQDITIDGVSAENITQSIRLVFISTVLMDSVTKAVATTYTEKDVKLEITDGPPAPAQADEITRIITYVLALLLVLSLAILIVRHISDVGKWRYKFGILSVLLILCTGVSFAAYYTQAKPAQTEYTGTYIGLVVGLGVLGACTILACFWPRLIGDRPRWWIVLLLYPLVWLLICTLCVLLLAFDLCIA